MKATEVFTPGIIPSYTYCERENKDIAKDLLESIETKGIITCISGPSKSGKTVLCKKVLGESQIVLVAGGSARTELDFWQTLRRKLSLPDSQTKGQSTKGTLGAEIEAGGKAGIPFLAESQAKVLGSFGAEKSSETTNNFDGLQGVDLLLSAKSQVIVIDDFHYIPTATQKLLVTQFKEAISLGVSLVIISVPYRSDDAVLANPDLRGRVQSIEIPLWNWNELREIPKKGFPLLNLQIETSLLDFLVKESIFSPQLMQTLCLELCRFVDLKETATSQKIIELDSQKRRQFLLRASSHTDCYDSFALLAHAGIKPQNQKLYTLKSGYEYSINRFILQSIAEHDVLEISCDSLLTCAKRLIDKVESMPSDADIKNVLRNMAQVMATKMGNDRVIDWSPTKRLVTVLDPYFLHYLRSSDCWVKFQ